MRHACGFTTQPAWCSHRRDPTIAVAAVLESERDDVGGEGRLIITARWDLALRRAMLAENPAGEALRDTVFGNDTIDTSPDDERGSEVSRGGFLQDQLLQRQIRYSASQPRILGLEVLQPFDLVALQAAVLLTPPIIRDPRSPRSLARSLSDWSSLRDQHIDLP